MYGTKTARAGGCVQKADIDHVEKDHWPTSNQKVASKSVANVTAMQSHTKRPKVSR